jgi:hypothetical protein
MRDDFTEDVKRAIASRVANRCSNPVCGAVTSGPQIDPAKAVNVGVAAHITAASPGGPRYDPSLTPEQRSHAGNGIWLCQTCAKLVDNDPLRYPADLLREWKAKTEETALSQVGKTASPVSSSHAGRPPGQIGIELPEPVNPIGHWSFGGRYITAWRFRVRLISKGQPLDIIELGLTEEGVGEWIIQEMFREGGRPVSLPISVERVTEFWIDARSPLISDKKSTSVGQITLRFRDHTQPPDGAHEHVVEKPPIK